MPGVYYSVQSNARKHLAVQLGSAVVKALGLSEASRKQLFLQALAKRFPTDEMLDK